MDFDINTIGLRGAAQDYVREGAARKQKHPVSLKSDSPGPDPPVQKALSNEELQRMLREIANFSDTFNRRLKFSVNRELNQVVVKVIDRTTDKVIKEIPHEGLQRLHMRLKEAMGLLFDEEI